MARYSSLLATLVAALLLEALAAAPARACASCSCGDPTLATLGVEQPYRNRLRVAVEERYGSLTTGSGSGEESAWFLRSSLAASWTPIARLTFAATLPWVTSWIRPAVASSAELNGLGDLQLGARVLVLRDRAFAPRHLLWVGAGLSFPTGYRLYDASGAAFPDDDQAGSGSWDPLAGLTYAWFSGGLLSLRAAANVRVPTPGWSGTRRGVAVDNSVALQAQPWRWGAFALGVDAIWTHSDTLAGGNAVPNTGGAVGYLAPALVASPLRDLLLRLVVDVPVVTLLNGAQSVGPQVALTVSYDVH